RQTRIAADRTIRSAYSRSAVVSGRQDVIVHGGRLALHLLQPVLDRIADRHDADQSTLVDDRQVPEFAGGHPLHEIADRLALVTGLDGPRHALADRLIKRSDTARRQRADNIAFGNDAADVPVGAEDERRADAFIGEQLCSFSQRGLGFDYDD